LGNLELALKDFDKSIVLYPESPQGYSQRALLKMDLKDEIGAIEDWIKEIDLNGVSAVSYLDIGVCYDRIDSSELAISYYSKAIDLNSNYTLAYANRALCQKGLDNYEGAESDYKKALMINKKYYLALNGLAQLYRHNEEYDKALIYYKKAIEVVKSPFLYGNIAKCYAMKNDLIRAIDNVSLALKKLKKSYFYSDRGTYYGRLDSLDLALDDFNNAIELDSTNMLAFMNRTYFVWLGKREFEKAIVDLNVVLKEGTEAPYPYVLSNKSFALWGLKQYDKALDNCLKSLSIDDGNSYAYKNLALIYDTLGDSEKAIIAAQKCIELNYPVKNDPDFEVLKEKYSINDD